MDSCNTCDYNFGQYNNFSLTSGDCINGTGGAGTCRSRPESYFIFHLNDEIQLAAMTNMLNTVILNVNISCQITSISETERGFIEFYPNPVSENLQFKVFGKNDFWEIINSNGQLILSGVTNNESVNISVVRLSPGIYVLRVIDGKRSLNRFFFKAVATY